MGRASRADAAKHREHVVAAAARLLRERGSAETSVQDVMSAAGLTHGGFYKQFASKQELTGIAVTEAFEGISGLLARIGEESADRTQARTRYLDAYLTPEHRDSPGTGCANTALASDAARAPADSPLRQSYTAGVKQTLDGLARIEPAADHDDDEARRQAIVDLATMVGALTLARGIAGDPLSAEILAAVRAALGTGR